jgi:hypothetical protein
LRPLESEHPGNKRIRVPSSRQEFPATSRIRDHPSRQEFPGTRRRVFSPVASNIRILAGLWFPGTSRIRIPRNQQVNRSVNP